MFSPVKYGAVLSEAGDGITALITLILVIAEAIRAASREFASRGISRDSSS